ncbi:hypothetical protein [Methylobacterium sp. SD21]|uniref:hypothetical protein n=1 Tax=Methylobacterium litchii TaxID=3138810 RepID=UPI00313F0E83
MEREVEERAFELRRLLYPGYAYNLQHQFKPTRARKNVPARPGFERGVDAAIEDARRVRTLRRWAKRDAARSVHPAARFTPEAALALARRLEAPDERGRPNRTFSCAAYMRRYRLRFVGAALRLAAEHPPEDLRLATIVPPDWRLPGTDLPALQPRQLLERFRQQLVRAGLKEAKGWLIAFVHGDYDPTHDAYQPHLHILMTTGLLPVLATVAGLPALRPGDPTEPGHVRRPVLVQRLNNPVRQISYHLAQGFWPAKASYVEDGVWRRSRYRGRIRAPRSVEYLMWLDRLDFRDLVLLHGCRIGQGRLRAT